MQFTLPFADRLQALLSSPHDFTFVFPSRECRCSYDTAVLLSPAVARLRASGSSICTFSLTSLETASAFPLLEDLIRGRSLSLDSDSGVSLAELLAALENDDLIAILLSLNFQGSGLNIENAVYRLRRNSVLGLNDEAEIDFVAAHFSEFDWGELMKIEFEDLVSIFYRLTSEASGFVEEIIRLKGERYVELRDILALPVWCREKGLACFVDDDEVLRPPDMIWKVPVDCSELVTVSMKDGKREPSGRRRPLIEKGESELVSSFFQNRGIREDGLIPLGIGNSFEPFDIDLNEIEEEGSEDEC
jgi:hypothetical protein